jgi:diguanylate cyclase (GGDEF)-like protein/PAS domain S-box-containing protein
MMQKLNYPKKFILLGLISLIAISVVVYGLFVSLNKDIRTLQQELVGLTLIGPIARTVQLMQQHRGLSSGLLSGVQSMREGQASKVQSVDDAINIVGKKLPARLKTSTDWQTIRADWQLLKSEGLGWSARENFTAQTQLIEKTQLFKVSMADEYALTLDSEIDTYYLIDTTINALPHVLEHLGQIRAYGIASLAARQADELQKMDFSAMMGELNSVIKSIKVNLEKTSRYNKLSMQNELLAASEAIEHSAQEVITLVKSDIFTGRFTTAPTDFYQMASAEINAGYSQMYESLLPTISALLQARIIQAEKVLYTSVGVALLLFMIVAYLAFCFYSVTIDSIQSLARSARSFASGNTEERACLATYDELRQVGFCFNEMADGFTAMLKTHSEGETRLRTTIENSLDAVVQMNAEGIITDWTNQAEKIFGWPREEAIGRSLHETIIPQQYCEAHVQGLKHFLLSGEGPILNSRIEMVGLHRNGHEFPIELSVATIKVEGTYEFSAFIHDITERKQAENTIALTQLRHEEAQRIAHLGHWTHDLTTDELIWSDENYRIFGVEPGSANTYETFLETVHPDDREFVNHAYTDAVKNGTPYDIEHRLLMKDGSIKWVHERCETDYADDGSPLRSMGTALDITKHKKAEENIHRLAFYDPLTQLPNRRLLLDRLQQAMAVGKRRGLHGAVLFLDLDHFKKVNDTQGHTIGDLLLVEVAGRLRSCMREGDSIARLGGDEFVVLLEELSHQSDEAATQAELVAEKIRDELSQPYALKGFECHITPSSGINLFHGHQESVEELLQHADVAMYQAKAAGRNAIRFFDPQMQTALDKRAAMEMDLRQALAKQQFRLYYQVQVDSHGKATGAEVLLRWEHPERGFIFPDQFIPLSEETGLIVPIGLWVLQTACAQLKAWQRDALTRELTLAVNVSAKQFHQADFFAQVQRMLQESGANPSQLKLELTESIMLKNVEDSIAKMREIKLLGVSFSMDDFGTGYSSLSYLKRLPLDQIKIDRSFLLDITSDPNDAAIVQAIIVMTEALGLNVIAEGVETEAQRDFLDKHGCHAFQGYLFGKPMLLDQFEMLLKQG